MPEYPDITVYIERLEDFVQGRELQAVRIKHPFLLRTVTPPLSAIEGKVVQGFERIGKRIVLAFEDELYMVLHLMISGRLRWRKRGIAVPKKRGLAAFDFEHGSLLLTEASSQKRASLHVVQGADALEDFKRGGLEVMESTPAQFDAALRRENHTLKRALTDQRILSGIGNAYSDEILHRARLSPFRMSTKLNEEEMARLFEATIGTLGAWTERLRDEVGDGFPEKVTAFHPDMAVHGRYGQPCPDCGTKVQRIRYATNETNYCPHCQTEDRLLADRALSRLLKDDWPRTVEALEALKK